MHFKVPAIMYFALIIPFFIPYLAPTGAQGVTMSVSARPSVRAE